MYSSGLCVSALEHQIISEKWAFLEPLPKKLRGKRIPAQGCATRGLLRRTIIDGAKILRRHRRAGQKQYGRDEPGHAHSTLPVL